MERNIKDLGLIALNNVCKGMEDELKNTSLLNQI